MAVYWAVSAVAIMGLLMVLRAARLKWRFKIGDFGWRSMAVYGVIGGAAIAYAIDVATTKEVVLPDTLLQELPLAAPIK